MKTSPMRHPDDGQLLRYADGELPTRAAGQTRAHLETCWQCRVELEELQTTVSECVHYRKHVIQSHLPTPPAPWMDIYRQFKEIDASMEPDFFARLARLVHWPAQNAKRWIAVAAAVLIACLLFYRYHQTPSVQAAQLLRRAVDASVTHPVKLRAIQIRTRDHRFVRSAASTRRASSSAADAQALEGLRTMFVAANYDWDNPLSARSYQAWRDQLREKSDQVTEESNVYRIRTTTQSSELVAANLTLRAGDLRPVEERLEFRNQEWVEISEVADESAAAAQTEPSAATTPVPANHSGAVPNVPAASVPPEAPATAADELRVLAALHDAGADLGEPIEVSRASGKILVTGTGLSEERRQQLHDLLASQTNVVVRFTEPAPAGNVQRGSPVSSSPGADIRQLQARIADQIGGRANFDQLAAQVLDVSEPMMSRAYALRRLAAEFPVETESQLSAADRQLLGRIREEHARALLQRAAEVERLLKPALASVARAPLASGAAPSGVWQKDTEELFQSARRVDKLVAVMFGAAPGESAGDQLPAQLLTSLAQLRIRADAYYGK